MDWDFDITLKSRALLDDILESFSLEQLNTIPNGFNNNIIWNIGHTIATQQLLIYNLSSLPMLIPDSFVKKYRKGTTVKGAIDNHDLCEIKALLFSTIEQTKADYKAGKFKQYTPYTTKTSNSTISSIEAAIPFNNYHEGIHLGYILALKKAL